MYPSLLCLPLANACSLLSTAVHQDQSQCEEERVSFCLQVTFHHWEKSGQGSGGRNGSTGPRWVLPSGFFLVTSSAGFWIQPRLPARGGMGRSKLILDPSMITQEKCQDWDQRRQAALRSLRHAGWLCRHRRRCCRRHRVVVVVYQLLSLLLSGHWVKPGQAFSSVLGFLTQSLNVLSTPTAFHPVTTYKQQGFLSPFCLSLPSPGSCHDLQPVCLPFFP